MKTCPSCLIEKDLQFFNNDKNTKDGKSCYCKECISKYKNSKTFKQYVKSYNRKHYKRNRQKIIEQKKEYQKNNPDKVKRWNKEWAKNNSEKIKEKQKKIRSTKKFKRWRNNYEKEKRLKDPAYKLRIHLSTKIREAIKKNNSFKGSSILKHLPYTLEQLIIHLENQFDNKMNWENHGSYWHIDHIIPQKSLPFDCLESENFKKCWALENLRPLEKTENLKKGSKLLNEVNNVGSA